MDDVYLRIIPIADEPEVMGLQKLVTLKHIHTYTIRFNDHFPCELGLAGCPLNSPPFIPEWHILLGQT